MTDYLAVVKLTDDLTGREFFPGDSINDSDFPLEVITNWLEIGALTPIQSSSSRRLKPKAGKHDDRKE